MPEPTRLPRAARRAQLIESAAGTFLRRGFEATSMDDVARDAGVSRLILYRIFSSKDELYRAILQSVIDHLGLAAEPYPVDAMRATGAARVLLPVARAHADAFRLLWRRALNEPQFADLALGVQEIFVFYARGIVSHYITDDDVRLEWAARTASAHLVEALCTWLDLGDPERDEEAAELMVAGLRALTMAWSSEVPPPVSV
ncbi:MAG: TetR/AcrR family transcriptional regulator [Ilumatobacteraceae bacterium]